MGRTYPDVYAAVGIHSGLPYAAAHDLPTAFAAMRGTTSGRSPTGSLGRVPPVIVFHGDQDKTVHPRNGLQIAEESLVEPDAQAAPEMHRTVERGQIPGGRSYTRSSYRAADGAALIEQWSIHGAGHAWSGGSSEGSFTDPRGPDASRAMVQFFLLHALST
jgi:poly(3-hydroxybutyrate) depolymerase